MAALAILGLLAGIALVASDLPMSVAWLLAIAAQLAGVHAAAREGRRPSCTVSWTARGAVMVGGDAVDAARLRWRGPLAVLQWRDADGGRHALSWWPDTLRSPARRELRLAIDRAATAVSRPSMAP